MNRTTSTGLKLKWTMTEDHRAAEVADKLLNIDLAEYTLHTIIVSTSMIPKVTAEAMIEAKTTMEGHINFVEWSRYGWIISVGSFNTNTFSDQYPELSALMDFARVRGYAYLQLDCDGDPLPEACGFPTFSW